MYFFYAARSFILFVMATLIRLLVLLRKWLSSSADPVSKWVTTLAIVIGGGWAVYQFDLAGSDDWVVNMSLSTDVLPYKNDFVLLLIHVRMKNPTGKRFDFDVDNSKYNIEVRRVPDNLKLGSSPGPDRDDNIMGELIGSINMLPSDGYELMPNADFDDFASIVVRNDSLVSVRASLEKKNGKKEKSGRWDYDYVSASNMVKVHVDRVAK